MRPRTTHLYVAEIVVPKWEREAGVAKAHVIAASLAQAILRAQQKTRDKRRSQVLKITRF